MGLRRRAVRAVLAAGLGGLALIGCGDDPPSAADQRADQARDAALDAGLGDEMAEFLALAARGTQATYRVTYAAGDDQELTVTQRPPDRRLDFEAADGSADSTIAVGAVAHQCRRTASGGDRQCGELPGAAGDVAGPFDPDAVAETTDALRHAQDAYEFRVDTRRLAGVDASCLATTLRPGAEATEGLGQSGTLCVSPEGVPLFVERPGERLTATGYETEIPDDAFELPA